MAVNVDTVYQRVLAAANKEQRGYVTPQEFNLFANQAQMDIFEQYFYDKNAFGNAPSNDTTYSDMLDLLQEKLDIFERYRQAVTMTGSNGVGNLPTHYRMGELYYLKQGNYYEIEKIRQNEIHHMLNSPLTTPSLTRAMYVRSQGGTNGDNAIIVYPTTINDGVYCNYIARPATVVWGYTVVNNQALYNANTSTNFELHQSEESELVLKILELAGMSIKDPMLADYANKEDMVNVQQEK
jgi:hypothetical protein